MPSARDPREVLERPAPPPVHVLAYGDHPDNIADLRLPARRDEPAPLVIVVHGGFWRASRDRSHAGPQSQGLADAGYAVATVEYRRVGGGGGCPTTFDDLATAVDAVPGLVSDVAGDAVDAGRVGLVGHSAGGHLALWAAQRHLLPATSRWSRGRDTALRGVVALGGVVDLTAARDAGLGDGAVDALVGVHDLAELDPARLGAPDRTVVLVHGADDEQVPLDIARGYVARYPAAHLWALDGVEHFALIDPLSPAWLRVLQAVELATAPTTTLADRADR